MKTMPQSPELELQNTLRNLIPAHDTALDSLAAWIEAYFQFEDTTAESSRKVKRRDLALFLAFVIEENGHDRRQDWTPRLSRAFKDRLRKELTPSGHRRWGDRTINRILAHVKVLAKWVHKHRPFPLGNPTDKIKLVPTASAMLVERALTPTEKRRMLDAADLLVETGGRSKDRHRYRQVQQRPRRKNYRPYRNRAIIYTFIGTGIRRAELARLKLDKVDFQRERIQVIKKGGEEHTPWIRREALEAIQEYLDHERPGDAEHFDSPMVFLPATGTQNKTGQLSVQAINRIWNHVCDVAGVDPSKTPHSARHAMGKDLTDKLGIAATQTQLGHKNIASTVAYTRPSDHEMKGAINP